MKNKRLWTVVIFLIGCQPISPDVNQKREEYNRSWDLMSQTKWEEAQQSFLAVRDEAGKDQELRQFASYNLAFSYAKQAKEVEESDPQKANELYQSAIAWFQDAIRLNEAAEDARFNLEVCLNRKRLLVDQLTKGENSLEKRLERLDSDLRMVRDQLRQLLWVISQANAEVDPSIYRKDMEVMAVKVRELQADASTILSFASDEELNISNIPEEERSQEEQMRYLQLQFFQRYLEIARSDISDSRRVLRKLETRKSLQRLDQSLVDVKRASEQLMNPIDVLGRIFQDQQEQFQNTSIQAKAAQDQLNSANEEQVVLPDWFTGEWLATQEQSIADRLGQIATIFAAVPTELNPESAEDEQYQQQAILEAYPFVESTTQKLPALQEKLRLENWKASLETEISILQDLQQAMEAFADVKALVEKSYQDYQQLTQVLKEQNQDPTEIWQRNQKRLHKLKASLALKKKSELQKLEASDDPSKLEELEEFYQQAETFRLNALENWQSLEQENEPEQIASSLEEIEQSLSNLRMMFFTVIEHLKDAAQKQQNIWDTTAEVSALDYEQSLEQYQFLLPKQSALSPRLQQISEVLQEQADAMAEQDPQKSEALGDAYVETALAKQYVDDVLEGFDAMMQDQLSSYDIEDVLENQKQSYEAIVRAIKALEPPQQNPDQDNSDQNQEQQDVSQKQAEQKMQEAKEREAKRAKERQQQQQEPVAKDW